jgi:hypothetical protein
MGKSNNPHIADAGKPSLEEGNERQSVRPTQK